MSESKVPRRGTASNPSTMRTWARLGRTRTLRVVLVSNGVLVGVLMVVGLKAHSLGVLAEGVDYLGDAAGVGVALLALQIARRPGGHPTATRYAAGANASWLLLLCLLIAAGSAHRLVTGTREVDGLPVLIVSAIAAVVMLGGAFLLGEDLDEDGAPDAPDAQEQLTMRAVLLDTAADAAAAAGVALAGAVILLAGGLYWLDPAIAVVISLVVAGHATRLLLHIRQA